MPYKISGTKSETARVIVVKESDWSIESNTVISGSGAYEVDGLETGAKTVIAESNEFELLGYGSVTPIEVEASGGEFERAILNPAGGGSFGHSLAATDTYLVIGAHTAISVPEGETYSGQVHMYNPTTGVLQGTIENPNTTGTKSGDYFGQSVALTDTYLLGGTPREEGYDVVYKFNTATRALLDTWTHPGNGTAEDWDPEITSRGSFGHAVDISPNSSYAIVGDPKIKTGGLQYVGKAFIINASTGAMLHILDNPTPATNDYFGDKVAINNTYAVVGARGEDGDVSNTGEIYIYLVATGALLWTIPSPRQDSAGYFSEDGVAINDDNKIVVSARDATINGLSYSGEAYIYDAVTGNLLHTLDNPNPIGTTERDWFGHGVDISSTHAVVGAYQESHVYHTASPDQTEWLFEDNFADLTNLSSREYTDGFYNCVQAASGDAGLGYALNDPDYQQYVMHDMINDKYYTMDWSSWGQGDGGSFAYTRQQVHATTGASIGAPVVFSHGGISDPDLETDFVDTGLEITRDETYGIFNLVSELEERRDPGNSDKAGKAYVFDVATGALVYTFDNPHGLAYSGYFGEYATINSTRAFVYQIRPIDQVNSFTL